MHLSHEFLVENSKKIEDYTSSALFPKKEKNLISYRTPFIHLMIKSTTNVPLNDLSSK